ncbi:MAG TPA: phosphoenolpyruvate carboxykinase (ATP), partial [Candidatus Polarisedimenticolia bacterium]|nr:phosphoenolpyruvate carboxykinase (ATP) [Candidatus Polarisedimenticolia bacterium]
PNCRLTRHGNVNVQTRVVARSKSSTFIVTDDPEGYSGLTISRSEGERVARLQDDYIRSRDMLVVDGYIGNDASFRTPARLIIEAANANIAAMQQILYYPIEGGDSGFEPQVTVIYTPNLEAKGYPNDRLIAVDLQARITRVFNSDYFGESKKGGLRMWNRLVYDRGGLAMHAGCKIIPVGDRERVALIIGLSGTGKTTTTFTRQNDSRPVQDDFLAMMPDGRIMATENGCFAKTFGLAEETEPAIHRAVLRPTSYLENVSQHGADLDFFDTSYTPNGRAVFRMSDIEGAGDARGITRADILLILNRNEDVIPAVARLRGAQAAAYFMLGETKGTSAGGAEEAGRFLRIPGTNPFFPLENSLQGNRFLALLRRHPMEVFLMNTGRVGGGEQSQGSLKVKIRHSSAVVKAIAEGTIAWEPDPDFGYEVACRVPGLEPEDEQVLRPRLLYERQGRLGEYRKTVERLRADRLEYMASFPNLDRDITESLS